MSDPAARYGLQTLLAMQKARPADARRHRSGVDRLPHLARRVGALPEAAEAVETIDLHTVVGQFTALRHEVNLQTKAARSALDQTGDAVRQLGSAVETLKDRPAADEGLKPLLKAVVDVYDNLALALKQVERQRTTIEPVLVELVAAAELPEPPEVPKGIANGISDRPRRFWTRLFGGSGPAVPSAFAGAVDRELLLDWRDAVLKDGEARRARVMDTAAQVRSSLDGLIAGYRMSLNRVDRAVGLVGLEPIPAAGERFDPELMEAVEVLGDPDRPAGEVVEEVRAATVGAGSCSGMPRSRFLDSERSGSWRISSSASTSGRPTARSRSRKRRPGSWRGRRRPILPSFVGLGDDGNCSSGRRPATSTRSPGPHHQVDQAEDGAGREDPTRRPGYRPQEISAMILRTLKDRAEKALGKEVRKAVVTVPAYFNDAQRQATIEAGTLAGLDVVRILNEPTAAALVYDPQQTDGTNVLVYDLGGGTFDVSIVRAEGGVVEVLASHGDTQLGGDDFDDLLVSHLCDIFNTHHRIDLREDRTTRARVLRAAEAAKRQLSDHAFTRVEEEFIAEKDGVPLHLSVEVTRAEFEDLIRPLIDRTMDCLQRSLDDARMTAAQIDRVVLVGGSTRVPMVSDLLEDRLGRPARKDINPDLCVAMGAAVQGAMIAGDEVGRCWWTSPPLDGDQTLDP